MSFQFFSRHMPFLSQNGKVLLGKDPMLLLVSALAISVSTPALADDTKKTYPRIGGELVLTIEDDFTFSSDDPAEELNNIYTDSELLTELYFAPQFKLVTLLHMEPVEDPTGNEFFNNEGLYIEEIFLEYEFESFTAYAGKYHPTFGLAWDLAPGIYGTDLAADYEIAERLGGGIGVPFILGGSEHTLAANVFFADTTFMSNSVFKYRERLHKDDGGVSNTESPESFSLTLDGGIPSTELAYHLGSQFQTAGEGDPDNQYGFVGGLTYNTELETDGVVSEFLVFEQDVERGSGFSGIFEVAYIVDQEGQPGDAFYATIGGAYTLGPWAAMASYTLRDQHLGSTDQLANFTIGYGVPIGPGELGVEVGYGFYREGRINSHTLGAILGYAIEF